MDRVDPETIARETGAYQRLAVLVDRTTVTIVPMGPAAPHGGIAGNRIRVVVGHLSTLQGEGDDLAAAIADVYPKVFGPAISRGSCPDR